MLWEDGGRGRGEAGGAEGAEEGAPSLLLLLMMLPPRVRVRGSSLHAWRGLTARVPEPHSS
eukprot:1858084-Rhodomonas_salina.2